LLDQHELRVRAVALNRSGRNVPGNAQMPGVGFVAHALELCDRHVIALVGLDAADGQPCDDAKNDGHRDANAKCLGALLLHG
jgi:hypothetical protein